MIVTDCNIQVNDDRSTADKNIIVYRGDYNVQVTFTITHINDYRYRGTDSGENLIESTQASYGQILIKNKDGESVFVISEIAPTNEGKVTLTILGEYINELVELGAYDYQIRLFSAEKEARLTIPPVEGQLIVKEPLIFGDQNNGSKVGIAQVNHAIILTAEEDIPTFDDAGSYNKTQWTNGDVITDGKLNKIEDALAVLTDESKTHATTNYVDEAIQTIELTPGPKGEQGEPGPAGADGKDGAAFTYDMFTEEQLEALRGPAGETGPKGEKGDTPSLDGYATEQYVNEAIANIEVSGGEVDLSAYVTKENPEMTGSFSLNRRPDSEVGKCSIAMGAGSIASGDYSHVEGISSTASGFCSHAEGNWTTASGYCSHTEGNSTTASGDQSHAEGDNTVASGTYSHAEGLYTIAASQYQHAQGKYNIEDTADKYAHIVGNGKAVSDPDRPGYTIDVRSNAYTLDWSGNAWFQGDVFIKGENQDNGKKLASEEYVTDTINQLGEAINTALENGELLKDVQLGYNKKVVLVDNLQVTQMHTNIDSAGFIIGDYPNVYYTLTLHMGGESQSVLGQVGTQDGISSVVFMEGAIQIYIGFSVSDTGEQITDPSKAVLIFYNLEIPEGLSVSLSVYGPQPYVTQDILNNELNNALGDIESLLGNI